MNVERELIQTMDVTRTNVDGQLIHPIDRQFIQTMYTSRMIIDGKYIQTIYGQFIQIVSGQFIQTVSVIYTNNNGQFIQNRWVVPSPDGTIDLVAIKFTC